jgi:alpha/beta superfamily hydrolase
MILESAVISLILNASTKSVSLLLTLIGWSFGKLIVILLLMTRHLMAISLVTLSPPVVEKVTW